MRNERDYISAVCHNKTLLAHLTENNLKDYQAPRCREILHPPPPSSSCQVCSADQKRWQMSTRNNQHLIQHQSNDSHHIFKKKHPSRNFRQNGALVTLRFVILGKKGKCSKALRKYSFQVKHKRKTERLKPISPKTNANNVKFNLSFKVSRFRFNASRREKDDGVGII